MMRHVPTPELPLSYGCVRDNKHAAAITLVCSPNSQVAQKEGYAFKQHQVCVLTESCYVVRVRALASSWVRRRTAVDVAGDDCTAL